MVATAAARSRCARWPRGAGARAGVDLARGAAPYALACVAVLPMVAFYRSCPRRAASFFATFERRRTRPQLASAAYYLLRFESCCAARASRAPFRCCSARSLSRAPARGGGGEPRTPLAACSCLLLALAAVWVALIARTPLFFSRYLVALSPLLARRLRARDRLSVALRRTRRRARATGGPRGDGDRARGSARCVRVPELRGRIAELREPYRGPLDHVIPYLAERYPDPADLVIATNYEDFSYMFYLRATTVLGYYAPERERDLAFVPDVIIPRPVAGEPARAPVPRGPGGPTCARLSGREHCA